MTGQLRVEFRRFYEWNTGNVTFFKVLTAFHLSRWRRQRFNGRLHLFQPTCDKLSISKKANIRLIYSFCSSNPFKTLPNQMLPVPRRILGKYEWSQMHLDVCKPRREAKCWEQLKLRSPYRIPWNDQKISIIQSIDWLWSEVAWLTNGMIGWFSLALPIGRQSGCQETARNLCDNISPKVGRVHDSDRVVRPIKFRLSKMKRIYKMH